MAITNHRFPPLSVSLALAGLLLLPLTLVVAAGGGSNKDKPDPVKTNGTIFKAADGTDWPKPDLALMFTGAMDGYLEPCGCAGLENQKGGLKRRHTFMKGLTAQGWPLVALDAGGQIRRFGPQAQIKHRQAVDSLIQLGYQGVGFGAEDLRMDQVGLIINLDEEKNPLTSANVGYFDFDDLFSRRWRVTEAGGMKVGFTSVLSDKQRATLGKNDDITLVPAAEALAEVTPELVAQNCDHLVLMVNGDSDEAAALSKQFPQYRWVISAVGADEPPHVAKALDKEKGIYLIEVGHKGMYAVVLGLYADAGQAFRYQKVPLDHRFEDAPEMQAMLVRYQDELKTLGLDALGAKPLPHPNAAANGGKFAGSAACVDCHEEEYEIWENTPHSHATKTIVDLDPPRHYDPECLSCHVTGWQPQKYYPYVSGYLSLEKTPHLNANGCENCHGPAAEHAAAENGDIEVTDERLEELRAAVHMKILPNEGNKEGQKLGPTVDACMQCHDLDNSPDFDFQEYWEHVKHGGGDDDDDE